MKKPVAHTPRVIKTSGVVGQYGVTFSKGLGVKPPITRPIPLSIHVAINTDAHANAKVPSPHWVLGTIRRIRERTAKKTAVHIHGTSLVYPSSPAKRNSNVCMCPGIWL